MCDIGKKVGKHNTFVSRLDDIANLRKDDDDMHYMGEDDMHYMGEDDINDNGGGGGDEEEEEDIDDDDADEEEEEEEEENNDNNNRNDENVALLIEPDIGNINQEVLYDGNKFHDDYFDGAYINIVPNIAPESHSTQRNHDSLIQGTDVIPLMCNSEA
ncbi:hypothetical protein PanWU01x14_240470 [Parasponia andersonii]|uniref:Uncharacterized protein n=1 Tax=Parasponia andersonii TaxID=3476 RepID=A0A2P5BGN1_PARAD|nr:hypothetical protein PanWU01x14_240470 [Parasponia andersonii]